MGLVYFYTIINPFDSDNTSGGPQAAKNIIRHIESLGNNVEVVTPLTEFKDPNDSDFNVYQDIFNDPIGSKWFSIDQYSELLNSSKPFAMSECAYTACTTAPYGDEKNPTQNIREFTRPFFVKATKVITASPMHGNEIAKKLGIQTSNFYDYLCEVDTELFRSEGKNRDIENITVGAINYWKGSDTIASVLKEKIHFVGYGEINLILEHGSKYLGKIAHDQMPELYNRSSHFVHLPRWKESFSITACEAALCGCHLLLNDNVGALSFDKDLTSVETYHESGVNFRDMIEKTFVK